MLDVLGLGVPEEDLYRLLVNLPGPVEAPVLADLAGLPVTDTAEILGRLAAEGLAIEEAGTYRAAPPAVALGALVRQRRDALRAAETELVALAEAHRVATLGHGDRTELVEIITGADAVRHRFAQVLQAATEEVRSLVVPDLTLVPPGENPAETEGLRRGVRYRVIIGRDFLATPERLALLISSIEDGEEVRVVDRVPLKMILADRQLGMLPLYQDRPTAPASVLVHASGLLDTMIALFDELWRRAHPLRLTAGTLTEDGGSDLDDLDRRVLSLLLAGCTDQAIAGQLDLSLRTVQRRVSALMERAGVQTRIQLGWHAATKNWA